MHIAVEGLDGVGKTTICNLFTKNFEITLVEKPLSQLFNGGGEMNNYIRIRDYVNQQNNKIFTSWFYGLGNIFLYHRYPHIDIITDRHLVSNYLWSGDETSESVFECLVNVIKKPDYTFILYADREAIRNRLIARKKNDPDLKKIDKNQPEVLYRKMEDFLKKYAIRYSKIDCNNLTPEETFRTMLDILKHENLLHQLTRIN